MVFFPIVRSAHVMLEEKKKDSLHIHLIEVTFK